MNIAIEALGIHAYGGGRTATLTLLEALFRLDAENRYLVFLSQPEPSLAAPAGNVRQWVAPVKNRFLMRAWAQLVLPWATRGCDLAHFSKNLGVFGVPAPTVVTMYDLTTLIHPELFPRLDVWYWRHVQKRTLQRAARVIAISETTARDLARFYGLPCERIRVIYPACAPHFRPASPEEMRLARQRYGLPERYLIHVGRLDRKKNLAHLVRAFDRMRRSSGFDGQLVLVGEEYEKSLDLSLRPTIAALGLQERVAFTGTVPDRDLPALYSGALAAVFTSLHEGFGLAPLEAMACGAPLVAYRAGALGEVAGEGALILDAPDEEAFAEALARVIQDERLRQELRARGLARAERFHGERTARQTLQLYQEVAAS